MYKAIYLQYITVLVFYLNRFIHPWFRGF